MHDGCTMVFQNVFCKLPFSNHLHTNRFVKPAFTLRLDHEGCQTCLILLRVGKNAKTDPKITLTFWNFSLSKYRKTSVLGCLALNEKRWKKIASLFSFGSCFTKRYKYHMLFLPFSLWIKFQPSSCFKMHSCGDDRKLLDWAFPLEWVTHLGNEPQLMVVSDFPTPKNGKIFGGDVCRLPSIDGHVPKYRGPRVSQTGYGPRSLLPDALWATPGQLWKGGISGNLHWTATVKFGTAGRYFVWHWLELCSTCRVLVTLLGQCIRRLLALAEDLIRRQCKHRLSSSRFKPNALTHW